MSAAHLPLSRALIHNPASDTVVLISLCQIFQKSANLLVARIATVAANAAQNPGAQQPGRGGHGGRGGGGHNGGYGGRGRGGRGGRGDGVAPTFASIAKKPLQSGLAAAIAKHQAKPGAGGGDNMKH
jgi:hypothetical protein